MLTLLLRGHMLFLCNNLGRGSLSTRLPLLIRMQPSIQLLEELSIADGVRILVLSSLPFSQNRITFLLIVLGGGFDPFWDFPVLNETPVDLTVVPQAWSIFLDFLHPGFFILTLIHFLIHLVEKFQLFRRSGDHLIDLLIVGNLSATFIIRVLFIVLLEDLFKDFLSIHISCVIVILTSLDDLFIKTLFVSSLAENAFLDFSGCNESINSHL